MSGVPRDEEETPPLDAASGPLSRRPRRGRGAHLPGADVGGRASDPGLGGGPGPAGADLDPFDVELGAVSTNLI